MLGWRPLPTLPTDLHCRKINPLQGYYSKTLLSTKAIQVIMHQGAYIYTSKSILALIHTKDEKNTLKST